MDIAHLLLPKVDTYQRALTVRSARQSLLSRNLANASTPGYRAVDLPFEQAMNAAAETSTPSMAATDAQHLEAAAPPTSVELVEIGSKPGLDGNTVDMEEEAGRMAENSLMYDATAQLTAAYFSHLLHAIREGR